MSLPTVCICAHGSWRHYPAEHGGNCCDCECRTLRHDPAGLCSTPDCGAVLLFSSRQRGDGMCGPCSRAAQESSAVAAMVKDVASMTTAEVDAELAGLGLEVDGPLMTAAMDKVRAAVAEARSRGAAQQGRSETP